jgi:two-component system response regulator (stage 0 sporulation protein A)
METINVLIAEDNAAIAKIVEDALCDAEDLAVVGRAADGLSAVHLAETLKPSLILLDIVLPELDGFGVLQALHAFSPRPKVLVLSALSQDSFIQKALSLGADYYMIKPFDTNVLKARIRELFRPAVVLPVPDRSAVMNGVAADAVRAEPLRFPRNKSVEEKITNIFITVGIPAHIKGYQFLREAIKLAIENPEIINCITKKLYPYIARRFDTSASKVERAIRHAIEVAWNRGKIENINSIFGVRVYTNNEKPTNGEFIALVANKMLIEGA